MLCESLSSLAEDGRASPAYADLLHDISSLHADLQESKAGAAKIANENKSILEQNRIYANELSELRTRLVESKDALHGQIRSTCVREEKLGNIESRWKSIVEKERQEIEKERTDVLEKSRSLVQMRDSIHEKLQQEYEERFANKRREMEVTNRKYQSIHRNFELYKANHDAALESALQNAEVALQAREREAATFGASLEKLVEAGNASSMKLRALNLESKECQLRMKQMSKFDDDLRSELRTALEDKKKCEASMVDLESRYSIQLKEIQSENINLEYEGQTLRSDITALQNELEEIKVEMRDMKGTLFQTEHALTVAKMTCDENEGRIQKVTDEAQSERDRFQKMAAAQQVMAKREQQITLEQKRSLEIEFEDNQTLLHKLKSDSILAEDRSARDYRSSLNELVLKNAALQRSAMTLKNTVASMEAESVLCEKKIRQAVSVSQYEASVLLKEKKSLEAEVQSLEELTNNLKDQLLDVQKNFEQLVDKSNTTEAEMEDCIMKFKDLTSKYDIISSELRQEKAAHKRAAGEREESQKKWKTLIQKEKRKADAYKQKAIEAQKESAQAKQLLTMKFSD